MSTIVSAIASVKKHHDEPSIALLSLRPIPRLTARRASVITNPLDVDDSRVPACSLRVTTMFVRYHTRSTLMLSTQDDATHHRHASLILTGHLCGDDLNPRYYLAQQTQTRLSMKITHLSKRLIIYFNEK